MSDTLYIKQINLHHCKGATSLIDRHLYEKQTNKQNLLVMIQEPWINKSKIHGLDENKYNLFYDRTSIKPRACIIATKELNIAFMPQFSSGDCSTVIVNLNTQTINEELIFSSVYMDGNKPDLPDRIVRDTIEYSTNSGIPIIVGADCNAHHTLWGSSDNNNRGAKLAEYLATTNLDICNIGNSPTFVNKIRHEVLDVTFTTQCFMDRVKGWHVSNEETLSDHREINFYIEHCAKQATLFRNPRNINWETFNDTLKRNLSKMNIFDNIDTPYKLETAVEQLNRSMDKAFIRSCPGRVSRPKQNHWWNNELARLKSETRRLQRIAMASKGSASEHSSWLVLRKSRCKYTKEIRSAKATHWESFCHSIENASAISRLHKLLAKDPSKGPGILKKPNGEFTTNGEEAAQLLLNTHFPGNVEFNSEITTVATKGAAVDSRCSIAPSAAQNDIANQLLTHNRVEWAIHTFEKYKSPGRDKIYPVMLQKSWHIIDKHIVKIYKASLSLCYIPKQWQEVKVTFIPKPGKEDYSSPKSFRPISLTSVLLKGLERLVDRHIKEEMNETFQIHESQHAFQQGKSTESALHELVSQIENTFDKKEFLVATFMDIAGAFDNISFDAISTHITECGLNAKVIDWIKFMLTHRTITFESHGNSKTVKATRGTPQGGVLSPTLWIIVMDSLLKRLQNGGFKVLGYADDLTVICRGKHLHTLSDLTHRAVKIVEKWCMDVGLTVNPDKSDCVIFTRNRNLAGFRNPTIFGKEITRKKSVKYLGVILESKLNWNEHIENRIKKSLRIFWCCRSAIGKSWGLRPKCTLWIYTAIVRQMLAYAAFIWWTSTLTSAIRNN